jgi:hypothetical protein
MKRPPVPLAAAGLMAITATGGALADQPAGLEPNLKTNTFTSGSCIA